MARVMIFSDSARGAGMTEVLLTMAILAIAMPFAYNRIADTNHDIENIAIARRIMDVRSPVLNFVRLNQASWPDTAQIKLSQEELAQISATATAGFIDKYPISGVTVTDVYLAFPGVDSELRTARVANHIGADAAVVGADGIAYGDAWAVTAPDFRPGDLIYRVTRDIADEDKTKYLHRGTSGEDGLNVMMRDLNMGGYNVFDVGTASAVSARIRNANATFTNAEEIMAQSVFFSDGATMDGAKVGIGALRVTGDIMGFRNISAEKLNGSGFTSQGRVITDRAVISDAVNVSGNLVLKSDAARTISGFVGINANSVAAPFISADQMIFYENFGLTISGELMMSTTSPLKIGRWIFPSLTPPQFAEVEFTRAPIPQAPSSGEFGPLMMSGWRSIPPKDMGAQ